MAKSRRSSDGLQCAQRALERRGPSRAEARASSYATGRLEAVRRIAWLDMLGPDVVEGDSN